MEEAIFDLHFKKQHSRLLCSSMRFCDAAFPAGRVRAPAGQLWLLVEASPLLPGRKTPEHSKKLSYVSKLH